MYRDAKLGHGIGCYQDNILLGFAWYKTKANKYWRLKHLYPEIWMILLLEVHLYQRQQGIGSRILDEIYRRLPKGKALVIGSERTEKHKQFYIKNGFVEDEAMEYFFIKSKF